jgi:hypothetical protein
MRSDDAWGAVAELGALHHGAFTRRQATLLGISARDIQRLIRARLVDEPARGVLRFSAAPATWHQELFIATVCGSGGFAAAVRAAARLHHIDGFRRNPTLEIVGQLGRGRIGIGGVVQHWTTYLPKQDLVVLEGISSTGLARTVCDLCAEIGADEAVRVLDDFERRGANLNWLRLTAERLHRPGQRGTGVVLRLLDRRQVGGRVPDSWFERLVERCVAIPGLPPWERRYVVRDDAGRFVAEPDLACPALRLAVEAHSREFHFGSRPEAFDQRRDNRLGAQGWDVRYVGWYDTEDPAMVADMLEVIARRRAAMLGVQLPWVA